MRKPPRKHPGPSEPSPPTPSVREVGDGLAEMIQATQEQMRRRIDADPLLREQVYGDDDSAMDGLTKDIIEDLRQFLNIPKPARRKGKKTPHKGKKKK